MKRRRRKEFWKLIKCNLGKFVGIMVMEPKPKRRRKFCVNWRQREENLSDNRRMVGVLIDCKSRPEQVCHAKSVSYIFSLIKRRRSTLTLSVHVAQSLSGVMGNRNWWKFCCVEIETVRFSHLSSAWCSIIWLIFGFLPIFFSNNKKLTSHSQRDRR